MMDLPPAVRFRANRVAGPVLLAGSLQIVVLLAGCATTPGAAPPRTPGAAAAAPVEVRRLKVAGGKTVEIRIEHGDAKPVETSEVKVQVAGFVADRERQELVYVFGFREKKGAVPRAVTVDDVTGAEAAPLVADAAPRLSRDGYWTGKAAPQRRGSAGLAWLGDAGDTFRVYRLTITTADGRTLVLFQAAIFGTELKAAFRQILGYEGRTAT